MTRRDNRLKQRLNRQQDFVTRPIVAKLPPTRIRATGSSPTTEVINLPVVYEETIPAMAPLPPGRSIPLVLLAYSLGVIGLSINGWFSYSRGVQDVDKLLMLSLGFIAEGVLFFLPSQASNLWKGKRYGACVISTSIYALLFVFAITNSLGFASLNLTEVTQQRAERVTPAVADSQRRLDTISASRASECTKRGDKCRAIEKEEQLALQSLTEARQAVSATSDPQVTAAVKLTSWVSVGRLNPTAGDFELVRLLLLTLIPQIGGLVLMTAVRR